MKWNTENKFTSKFLRKKSNSEYDFEEIPFNFETRN